MSNLVGLSITLRPIFPVFPILPDASVLRTQVFPGIVRKNKQMDVRFRNWRVGIKFRCGPPTRIFHDYLQTVKKSAIASKCLHFLVFSRLAARTFHSSPVQSNGRGDDSGGHSVDGFSRAHGVKMVPPGRQVFSKRLSYESASSLPLQAFCQAENVTVASFDQWRKKLDKV